MELKLMHAQLPAYLDVLRARGLAGKTILQYEREIELFFTFSADTGQADPAAYRTALCTRYQPSTVNAYLTALNAYLAWLGRPEAKVKLIRSQSTGCREDVLTPAEYHRLLRAASASKRFSLVLLMRTLAGTGIRIGELGFVTVESLLRGSIDIYFKKKQRTVCLPTSLSAELLSYCRSWGISHGPVFRNRAGTGPACPATVWRQMKRCARHCGVDPQKVYPHSFRHLFAKQYMLRFHDVIELADLLGHSSVETTRIYTRTSLREKRDRLDSLWQLF